VQIKKQYEKDTTISSSTYQSTRSPLSGIPTGQVVEYLGSVSISTNEKVLSLIKHHLQVQPDKELFMVVTSAGGPSGIAMSLYDTIRLILRPRLVTIGSGDVDSSGVILFLTGETRFVTPHTTMYLHLAGRTFNSTTRYTAHDLEMMAKEDKVKDQQYADIVSENSHGKLTRKDVLTMMHDETVLTPEDMLACGLADTILS
jgi:ATP-dependent Clp protease protease subunit